MTSIEAETGGTPAPASTAPAHAAAQKAAATVFYDGGCPVCRREIDVYRDMAGGEGIDWVDVTTAPEDRLPAGQDRAALLSRFTVRTRDGRLQDGAAGFIALWRGLDRMRWLARVLDRWPLRQIAELGYRGFLRARPLWRGREG